MILKSCCIAAGAVPLNSAQAESEMQHLRVRTKHLLHHGVKLFYTYTARPDLGLKETQLTSL